MNRVNLDDAKTHLSERGQRTAAGEDIVIARNGKPAARLVALAAPAAHASPGAAECTVYRAASHQVWMAPDLDEADATIAAWMLDGDPSE